MAEPALPLPTRIAVLEEQIKPLQEFRAWMAAILAGVILSLVAGGVAWGRMSEKLDRLADDVSTLRHSETATAER